MSFLSSFDVWHLAVNGYPVKLESTANLSQEEIVELTLWPPVVSYNEYQKYRYLWKNDNRYALLRESGGIDDIIPEISTDDIFFYLTRGYLHDSPHIRRAINRLEMYDRIQDINQELLNKIYGNRLEFAKSRIIHPLEPYIFEFDRSMGNRLVVAHLGHKLGVDMKQGDPDIILHDWLEKTISES